MIIYILFLITGGTGLIYQIAWTRDLTLVFGSSHQAVSIVLAAFMGGLALGGAVFGRWGERVARPLRLYAYLEFAVAVCAFLFPFAIAGLDAVYIEIARQLGGVTPSLALIRIVFSFAVLIAPTLFMGGTLPVLIRFLVQRREEFGGGVSMLYGINTLGAVIGTIVCGFFLLPALGVLRTEWLAGSINLLVAAAAYAIDRKQSLTSVKTILSDELEEPPCANLNPQQVTTLKLTFWGTAVCGLSALALEALWTRGLSIALGTTTYSFTIMLASFLTGICLGSLLNSQPSIKWLPAPTRFCFILLLAGLSSFIVSQAIPSVPQISVQLHHTFGGRLSGFNPLTSFLVCYLILLIPATLFGMAFPTAAEARAELRRGLGRSVGDCLALNTLGAIVGALLAGFALVPLLGLQRSMLGISVLLGGYGILIASRILRERIDCGWLAWGFCVSAWIAVISLLFRATPWDLQLMGAFRNNAVAAFADSSGVVDVKRSLLFSDLVYYREGRSTTVSVTQSSRQRAILINGKSVASDSTRDISLEKMMGQIPCLLHPDPKSALVVGLGAGVTLGSVTIQPGMEHAQLVEIEPAVLGAAETFSYINNNVLHSPNLTVNIQDGRNFLRAANDTFDVITADPIHPWAAGSTYLYTTEYYEIAKARLNPGGIMCQWVPLYELSEENLKSIYLTFLEVFDYCQLWQTNLDSILVGSDDPLVVNIDRIAERIQHPRIAADLSHAAVTDVLSFLTLFVTGEDGLRLFCQDGILNTDDNLYLEFSSPLSVGGNTAGENHGFISALRSIPQTIVQNTSGEPVEADFIERWKELQKIEVELIVLELSTISSRQTDTPLCHPETIGALERLFNRAPEYERTRRLLSLYQTGCGVFYANQNNPEEAKRYLLEAIKNDPRSDRAHLEMANWLIQQKKWDEAVIHAEKTLALAPMNADAWITRGSLHEFKKEYEEAEVCFQKALVIRPSFAVALYNLGALHVKQQNLNQAVHYFIQTMRRNPEYVERITEAAGALLHEGFAESARELFEEAQSIKPDSPAGYLGMGLYWQIQKETAKALRLYTKALRIDPSNAPAHFYIASAYYEQGKYTQAKKHLDESIQLGFEVDPEYLDKIKKNLDQSETSTLK